MQYREGRIGRVFVVKIENGDNLLECIKQLAETERINSAAVMMLGALKDAVLVVGPKEPVIPPDPAWREFDDGREIVGIGTLFRDESGPNLHLHLGVGKGDEPLVGCIRKNGRAFIVVEVVILEIAGIEAERRLDAAIGLKVLSFLEGKNI